MIFKSLKRQTFAMPVALLLSAAAAGAEPHQIQCHRVYQLGETVPPACRDALKTGAPVYLQWGEGYGAAPTNAPPPAASSLIDRRHQGGYNSSYGFGR